MASDVRARIRVGKDNPQIITYGGLDPSSSDSFPCKEWSVTDDIMSLSDAASVSIANVNGENTGKIQVGMRIEIEESDPSVANGEWIRHYTGVVTNVESYDDVEGGTNILIAAMDLGWHLSSGKAKPLVQIKSKRFGELLDLLLDPSWGFGTTQATNDLNKRIKHGRQVIIQNHKPQLGAILPFIQVEPGQAPLEIISTYAAREGVLVNVSAKGELVFFRPKYDEQPLYFAAFHNVDNPYQSRTNVKGRPTLQESIDGLYSEVQCWSTVVIPPEIQNTENPNEVYRHNTYTPPENPLPFFRREVFSDGEAINKTLRRNRAIWKYQLGLFNSWTYTVTFDGHSQRDERTGAGAFFVSDTMISVNDSVHKLEGVYYVQSVQRSSSLQGGLTSKLVIRKPGLLNPQLTALDLGGGAKKAARRKKPKA